MNEKELTDWLEDRSFYVRVDDNGWIREIGTSRRGGTRIHFHRILEIQELHHISLRDPDHEDSDLKLLANIKSLRSLAISAETKVTGKGFRELLQLPKIEELFVHLNKNGDEGLEYIGQMTTLKELDLWESSDITDAGLSSLSHLVNLERLSLRKCKIDSGASVVAQFPKLKYLSLERTEVSDATISNIARCTELETLLLSNNVTDEGISHLAQLENLKFLYFGGEISEKSIRVLSTLPNLESLRIGNARFPASCLHLFANFPKLNSLMLYFPLTQTKEFEELLDTWDAIPREVHISADSRQRK